MTVAELAQVTYESFLAALILTGPFLVVAMVIGVFLALIQAVTQIQDQTFPQVIKILVVSFMALALGASLSNPLYQFTLRVFVNFPVMVE